MYVLTCICLLLAIYFFVVMKKHPQPQNSHITQVLRLYCCHTAFLCIVVFSLVLLFAIIWITLVSNPIHSVNKTLINCDCRVPSADDVGFPPGPQSDIYET